MSEWPGDTSKTKTSILGTVIKFIKLLKGGGNQQGFGEGVPKKRGVCVEGFIPGKEHVERQHGGWGTECML